MLLSLSYLSLLCLLPSLLCHPHFPSFHSLVTLSFSFAPLSLVDSLTNEFLQAAQSEPVFHTVYVCVCVFVACVICTDLLPFAASLTCFFRPKAGHRSLGHSHENRQRAALIQSTYGRTWHNKHKKAQHTHAPATCMYVCVCVYFDYNVWAMLFFVSSRFALFFCVSSFCCLLYCCF